MVSKKKIANYQIQQKRKKKKKNMHNTHNLYGLKPIHIKI